MHPFSECIPALVASLSNDPFYRAITVDFGADKAAREGALGCYFAYSLAEAERTGRCVFLQDQSLGAAAWLLPRAPTVEALESEAKAKYLAGILGPEGNKNYHQIVRFMSQQAEQLVPKEAWYLSIIGVLPSQQGQGVGAKLLDGTLAETRARRVACYLETFTPQNLAFYERVGFKRVAAHLEPITNAEYVVMRRDA